MEVNNTREEVNKYEETTLALEQALGCEPEEFYKKYKAYKKAEAAFNKIYEPFKENLIKLHDEKPDLDKNVIVGGIKVTYVAPTARTILDTKKLKEEEPELVKQFMKVSKVKASVRLEELPQ